MVFLRSELHPHLVSGQFFFVKFPRDEETYLDQLYNPMKSTATTIEEYLAEIPEDRMELFVQLRRLCKARLEPLGFVECINSGMIGYVVPKEDYPAGYHCDPSSPLPFVNLANQK